MVSRSLGPSVCAAVDRGFGRNTDTVADAPGFTWPEGPRRLVENVPAEESPSGQALHASGIQQREFIEWREQSRTFSHMSAATTCARWACRCLPDRWFGKKDGAGAQPAMMINRALARQYFGAENPVGTLVNSIGPAPWEIIGVVDDVGQATLDREPAPQFFLDFRQSRGDPMLQMTDRVLGGRFTSCGRSTIPPR